MESLSVYIPTDRRIALSKGENLPDRTTGAVLFTDISGFTPLAETLVQKLGPHRGAEELTHQLNSIYTTLINQVQRYRGSVINFSGDAITCWFDGDDGRRAVTCALAMQKAMIPFQSVPSVAGTTVSFSVKSGITAGSARRFLVGNPRVRSIETMAGKLLYRVATAERLAQHGETVVGSEIIQNLPSSLNISEWRTGRDDEQYAVISGIKQPAPEMSWESIPIIPAEHARDWLLPAVYERLCTGAGEFLSELRPVVAMFVKFTGIHYEKDDAEARLDQYIRWVQEVLSRLEGNLIELTIGDKGSYMYIAFGAPQAHEDDAERAAEAALALLNFPPELDYIAPPQIGLSLGQTRTGSYGSPTRRSYAAQGRHVNLAARLMSHAQQGQILASQVLVDAARHEYRFEPRDTMAFKGLAQPIPIYELRGQLRQQAVIDVLHQHAQAAMIGRQHERNYLAQQLDALRNGEKVPLVFIQGEAGIGKSRLVADLVEVATTGDIPNWAGAGDAIEKSTPYLAWRSVFTRFFELEWWNENTSTQDVEKARDQVLSRLKLVDETQAVLAPLLNVVLPFNFPENETTSQMSGEVRANQTQDLCIALLKNATSKTPHVLIIEDAHWLDSASWILLRLVSRDVASLLIVIAMRPAHDPIPPDLARMLARPNVQILSLDSMPASEIETLICYRLNVKSLPEEVSRLIRDRAEGHPFFSEELAYALRDTGLITVENGECRLAREAVDLRSLNFPDTIDGVIISRIDSLPAQEQLLLKVASVVGRIFALRILRDIHPIESDKPQLPEYLLHLQSLDITPLETPEPDLSYIFKHIITQEVTYNLLLFAQRRELHRVVAEWFERMRSEDIASYFPLLVHHWRLAEDLPKTIDYLGKAGEQASSLGANQEAINFLMEALTLNERDLYVSDKLILADWEQRIGYAYLSMGRIDESIQHLRAALEHLDRHVPDSQAGYALGLLGGMIQQTFHRLWSDRFVGSSREPEVCLKAAAILQDMGVAVYHTSNPLAAMYVTINQLNEAERATPSGIRATGYAALAVLAAFFSPDKLAVLYSNLAQKAMAYASRIEAGYAAELLSMYNLGIGHWKEAQKFSEEAYPVYANSGNFRRWEENITILSSTLLPQGYVEQSLQLRRELEQLGQRAESPQAQVWALVQQAEIAMRQDRLADAIPLLEKAATLAQTVGYADQVWVHGVLASARLQIGQHLLAQQSAAASQGLIEKTMPNAFYAMEGYAGVAEVGITLWDLQSENKTASARKARMSLKGLKQFATFFPIGKPRYSLWEGMYQWRSSHESKAHKIWQQGLELAVKNQFVYEAGLLRKVIADHLEEGDPIRTDHLLQAIDLFSSIGATRAASQAKSALAS